MFKGIGQTDTSQAPGIIAYITLASADCSRVLTDEIDIMRGHATNPALSASQRTEMLQLINTNYAKCGGTSGPIITPSGPPIDQSTAPPDFFGGIGTIGIIAAIAVVGLLMMKR